MINKDFEYAKRFEDWLKGKNLNGIQEDVLKLRIENEQLKRDLGRKKETIEIYKQTLNEKEIQIEKMKKCPICEYNYDWAEPCRSCRDYCNWKMSSKWAIGGVEIQTTEQRIKIAGE